MATIGHPVPTPGNFGVVFDRRQDNQHVLRWQLRDLDTGQVTDKPLTNEMKIQVTLESYLGDTWLEYAALIDGDGYIHFGPTVEQLSGSEWNARTEGTYRVTLIEPRPVQVLAAGNLRIQQ